MSEKQPRPLIESAEPFYDRLHHLAEEEQMLLRLHEELHDEFQESDASFRHAAEAIKKLCLKMSRDGVTDRARALDRIEQLHRIMESRKLQMEKVKEDIMNLRGMEDALEKKLREAALVISPQAKA